MTALTFGSFLVLRRKRLGLSIRETARRIGVDHSRLVRWEHDETLPRDAVRLHAIAAALATPNEDFATLLDSIVTLSVQAARGVPVVVVTLP